MPQYTLKRRERCQWIRCKPARRGRRRSLRYHDQCEGQDDTIDVDADSIPDCIDPSVDSDGMACWMKTMIVPIPPQALPSMSRAVVIPVEAVKVKIGVLTPRTAQTHTLRMDLRMRQKWRLQISTPLRVIRILIGLL